MLNVNLQPQQKEIVKDICNEQIRTLINVSMEPSISLDIPRRDREQSISELMREFSEAKANPNIIFALGEHAYSLFKHTLLHNDERYHIPGYIPAKRNLWNKIIVRDSFNTLMT